MQNWTLSAVAKIVCIKRLDGVAITVFFAVGRSPPRPHGIGAYALSC